MSTRPRDPSAEIALVGARTGRIWRYHPVADRLEAPGSGERFRARADDDGSLACVHRIEKDSFWDDEIDRLRLAIRLAGLPPIATASTILSLLDVSETPTVGGEFGWHGRLSAVWEWAHGSLIDFFERPNDDPARVADQVQANVANALAVLHNLNLIHGDVTPNNILRVERVWKLSDLDSCTAIGLIPTRGPVAQRYVHPDRREGSAAARPDFDTYGLEQVVARIRKV